MENTASILSRKMRIFFFASLNPQKMHLLCNRKEVSQYLSQNSKLFKGQKLEADHETCELRGVGLFDMA